MTAGQARSAIVVGAGVAGLAAARHLVQAGVQVTVLEKNPHAGGRLFTDVRHGCRIDAGAQFLAGFYTQTRRLIRELGLETEVVGVPGAGSVLRAGRVQRLWPDARLALTRLVAFSSKLRSLGTLGRMLWHWGELDFADFTKAHRLDTRSIAEYARRHLDDDLLEYVIEPPLASLLSTAPEHISQAMLFLLLKAGLGIRLFTLRQGLQALPAALARGLAVQLGVDVCQVAAEPHGSYQVLAYVDGAERRYAADGVVCAVPATAVCGLFPSLTTAQREFFAPVRYAANLTLALGVDHRLPVSVYGLFFPRREVPHLASAAFQSLKNPAQVPASRDLVLLATSPAGAQALLTQDDAAVHAALRADLAAAGAPYDPGSSTDFYHVYRWPRAIPEFDVGHIRRLKRFAEGHVETGRVVFAGDYLGGPFVEGAISSGLAAARRLLQRFEPA